MLPWSTFFVSQIPRICKFCCSMPTIISRCLFELGSFFALTCLYFLSITVFCLPFHLLFPLCINGSLPLFFSLSHFFLCYVLIPFSLFIYIFSFSLVIAVSVNIGFVLKVACAPCFLRNHFLYNFTLF